MLESVDVAHGREVKEFLKFPTVLKRSLDLGHEFLGDMNCKSSSLHSEIEDMAGVFIALQADLAVLADAGTPTKAERAQSRRPESCGLIPKPLLNLSG